MKKILLISGFFLSTFVFSSELKLQCSVTHKYYSGGRLTESNNGMLSVEITEFPDKNKIIRARGIFIISFSTFPKQGMISYDYSRDNSWHIVNRSGLDGLIKSSDDSIRIDRDIGTINISDKTFFISGSYSEDIIYGTCTKVDMNVRKF